jgi:acyl-ACP thioesterase
VRPGGSQLTELRIVSFVKRFNRLYLPGVSASRLEPLAPRPARGRVFAERRKIRLGDVDRSGRLRFDALTRYTQDVSDDDTVDAGLDERPAWVVRSTVVDELAPARLGESLAFETFCSGLGSRWAERRLTVSGELGAHYEVATIWVCVDPESGRPHRLTDQFRDLYGEAAGDREVSARLVNPRPSGHGGRAGGRWQLRAVDFDVYGHVNNAAYWAAVEQWLPARCGPRRVRLEYGRGLADIDAVDIQVEDRDGAFILWWRPVGRAGEEQAEPAASASVTPLPVDLY